MTEETPGVSIQERPCEDGVRRRGRLQAEEKASRATEAATSTLDFSLYDFCGLNHAVMQLSQSLSRLTKVPGPQLQDPEGTLIQCVPLGNSMHSQTLVHSCDLVRTQNLLGELADK